MPDHLKHGLTLAGLIALVAVGALWGWGALTKPFPKLSGSDQTSPCVEVAVSEGDKVRPSQVWVSVLNASNRVGLASVTLDKLVERGFGKGDTGNAPSDAKVRLAQVWTADVSNPAAQLVRSQLGAVRIVAHPELGSRVVVVVGKQFQDLKKGQDFVAARGDATICSPRDTGV